MFAIIFVIVDTINYVMFVYTFNTFVYNLFVIDCNIV